jgi:hypothetical protein
VPTKVPKAWAILMSYSIKKHETNTKLIHKFMEYGSPMNQLFLFDALTKFSKIVIEQQDELRKEMQTGFFDPDAWIKSAEDFLQCLKDRE